MTVYGPGVRRLAAGTFERGGVGRRSVVGS